LPCGDTDHEEFRKITQPVIVLPGSARPRWRAEGRQHRCQPARRHQHLAHRRGLDGHDHPAVRARLSQDHPGSEARGGLGTELRVGDSG